VCATIVRVARIPLFRVDSPGISYLGTTNIRRILLRGVNLRAKLGCFSNDDASEQIAVSTEIFRCGMHHVVGAPVERIHERRGSKRRVHCDCSTLRVGFIC
jgi:hypothetical protein